MNYDREYILNTFHTHQVPHRVQGGFAYVHCPWHNDSNPSLVVFLEPYKKMGAGFSHCFVCDKSVSFFTLCAEWGIVVAAAGEFVVQEDFKLLQSILPKISDLPEYHKPKGLQKWSGDWRGLSEDFLCSIGCRRWWDKQSEEYRIWIPVGKRGHVAARLEGSDVQPKYRNSKGLDTKGVLFGREWIPQHFKYAILTEGPYDALKLQYHSFPATAVLGTGNWSTRKISLLARFQTIVLAFDNDDAGNGLTELVWKQLEHGFHVRVWPWQQNDAGDASNDELAAFGRFCSKF